MWVGTPSLPQASIPGRDDWPSLGDAGKCSCQGRERELRGHKLREGAKPSYSHIPSLNNDIFGFVLVGKKHEHCVNDTLKTFTSSGLISDRISLCLFWYFMYIFLNI